MRREGWEVILNDHIAQAADFAWGTNDCATWCAEWVLKATGTDFLTPWRGLYSTEAELDDLMLARGLSAPGDIPTRVGLTPITVSFAQRGDVMLHPQGCLGICNGIQSHFLMERGVTRIRTRDCAKAWRVG